MTEGLVILSKCRIIENDTIRLKSAQQNLLSVRWCQRKSINGLGERTKAMASKTRAKQDFGR
jgi:hypothetical protein